VVGGSITLPPTFSLLHQDIPFPRKGLGGLLMATLAQAQTSVAGTTARKKRGMSAFERYQTKWGLIFISPWLVGFLIFTLIPILATLAFSFSDYNPVQPDAVKLVGLQNYANMFKDSNVGVSLQVTVRYGALAIPITLVVGLFLAGLVNSEHLAGKNFFRTLFYMPYMIPVVAGAVVWAGVMNTQTGWLNRGIEALGLKGPDWLNSTVWIYPALVLIGLWGLGNLMLTLLAGMQGVPNELYEAAKIDGANGWQVFAHITLPLMTPIIFFQLIMGLIGSFQQLTFPLLLATAASNQASKIPPRSINLYMIKTYNEIFTNQRYGYGTALLWLLTIGVTALTLLVFWSQKFWVYQGDTPETGGPA
jgi:multiple sugar transport system permease protein